MGKQQTMILKA